MKNKYYPGIFTLLLCFTQLWALGQWTTNTAVNTLAAPQSTDDAKSVVDASGNTYIAFWHNVASPQYYELRLQKLDSAGVPKFGTNGMLVNGSIAMSSYIVTWDMVIDGNNNIYIGITGTGSGNPGVVHKISPSGTQLWTSSGVSIGSGYDLKILPLSSGEVIVGYLPGSHAEFQKFSSTGTAQWTNPKVLVPPTSSNSSIIGEMAELSGNKFEIIFYEKSGFAPMGIPYTQSFSASTGTAGWTSPTQLLNGWSVQTNIRHSIAKNNDTVFFGTAASLGTDIQGFIQRINPDGTTPWGQSGTPFSTQSSDLERDVKIAFEGEGHNNVWAIAEYSNSTQSNVGEYVQKLDATTGSAKLTATAKQVFAVGSMDRSHRGKLRVLDDQPVFLISDGNSNGVNPKDILLVQLDTSGNLNAATGLNPMATNTTGVKSRIELTKIVNDQVVATWIEDRSGSNQPYAQNFQLTPCVYPQASFIATSSFLHTDFQSTSSDADSVYWNFGDGNALSDSSAVVMHSYANAGTYQVCQYVFNDCGTDTLCQDITVCDTISATFTTMLAADSVHFTLNINKGDSIFWDFGDGSTASSTSGSITHQYLVGGSYNVSCTVYDACGNVDSAVEVVHLFGLEDYLLASHIKLWPNPASKMLKIQFPPNSGFSELNIRIFSQIGAQVLQLPSLHIDAASTLQIPVEKLPRGIYFIEIEHVAGMMKFVKL